MNNELENMLYVVLAIMITIVVILFIILLIVRQKEKNENDKRIKKDNQNKPVSETPKTTKIVREYETKSIFDFMEFEDVRDNMIVQKDGKRFLMAIECQGINYDLMSDIEKTSTEHGFASFLNTLRDPIQIYIQTRTVNLEKNIQKYKERLSKIKESLNLKEYKLNQYLEKPNVNDQIIKNKRFELLRETNLYNYGRDIITNTEKMSLNKNVLKKKYYIIIKYFYESTDVEGEELLSKEEIEDVAFSNLYTRATSLIRVLSGIGIVGKALNSYELVDLLYNAYNRDDSEVFGIDKAVEAGYNEIYIDAQNVIDKKIEALNKAIQLKAEQKVKDSIKKIEDEREQELKDLEDNVEDIILDLAKKMIADEKVNIPEETREKAIKNIEKEQIERGEKGKNGKKETKESTRKNRAV